MADINFSKFRLYKNNDNIDEADIYYICDEQARAQIEAFSSGTSGFLALTGGIIQNDIAEFVTEILPGTINIHKKGDTTPSIILNNQGFSTTTSEEALKFTIGEGLKWVTNATQFELTSEGLTINNDGPSFTLDFTGVNDATKLSGGNGIVLYEQGDNLPIILLSESTAGITLHSAIDDENAQGIKLLSEYGAGPINIQASDSITVLADDTNDVNIEGSNQVVIIGNQGVNISTDTADININPGKQLVNSEWKVGKLNVNGYPVALGYDFTASTYAELNEAIDTIKELASHSLNKYHTYTIHLTDIITVSEQITDFPENAHIIFQGCGYTSGLSSSGSLNTSILNLTGDTSNGLGGYIEFKDMILWGNEDNASVIEVTLNKESTALPQGLSFRNVSFDQNASTQAELVINKFVGSLLDIENCYILQDIKVIDSEDAAGISIRNSELSNVILDRTDTPGVICGNRAVSITTTSGIITEKAFNNV